MMRILKRVRLSGVIAAVGVVTALWSAPASAAPCTVDGSWNPDPSAANMTDCGPGTDGNDDAADVTAAINTALGTSFDFELWDRDGGPNEINPLGDPPGTDEAPVQARNASFFFTGTTSGFWFWNASTSIAEGNTVFALILKDGNGGNDPIRWAWFLLDNVDTTTDDCVLPIGFTHCGPWSMYSNKDVSHISLYGSAGPLQVPNPASLMLIGAGLAGLGYVTRRKLTK